jgi:chaperone required for assembly of F1-ATPase
MLKVDTTLNLATIGTLVAIIGSAAVGLVVMRNEDLRTLNELSTKQVLLSTKFDDLTAQFVQAKTDDKLFTTEMRTALARLQTDLAVSNAIRAAQPGGKK